MNKAEFIEVLSTHFDGNKAEAARALNAVTQTITYQTATGEKVTITGFGVFEKVHRSARMVRNPRTGERKRAKATAIPRFRAGTDLKAEIEGPGGNVVLTRVRGLTIAILFSEPLRADRAAQIVSELLARSSSPGREAAHA